MEAKIRRGVGEGGGGEAWHLDSQVEGEAWAAEYRRIWEA